MNNKIIKYLGIDWGEKRIGLAIGDSDTKIATPFKVVNSIKELVNIIKQEGIDKAVVGKPLPLADFKQPLIKEYTEFINILTKEIDAPIELIDERLSSKGADALAGTKKTKAPRDAIAAMLILQTYLDKE